MATQVTQASCSGADPTSVAGRMGLNGSAGSVGAAGRSSSGALVGRITGPMASAPAVASGSHTR